MSLFYVSGAVVQDSPIMQGEMKRIEAGVKMEPLDETRMACEPPRLHEQQNVETWKKCVKNAASQLEHQHHRCAQLPFPTPA